MSRRSQGKFEECVGTCVRYPIVYYSIAALRWFPVVFIAAVICWAYYAYVFELCFWSVTNLLQRILYLIFAHILLILFLWSYFATIFTPVGKPPKTFDAPQSLVTALDEAENFTARCQILDNYVRQTQLPITMRDYNHGIRYCEKCECLKPDRSHHCSICGQCVLKFDHHCPWVNTCVNFKNYKYFIQFLGYALAMCVYGALTVLPYFIKFWKDGLESKGRNANFHILFLFFAAGIFSISVATLFFYHIYLTAKNRSTIENFRSPVFTYGEDKNGFNLGWRRNFIQVFGRNKILWFLPKSSSIGVGVTYPLRATDIENPQMAENGTTASATALSMRYQKNVSLSHEGMAATTSIEKPTSSNLAPS